MDESFSGLWRVTTMDSSQGNRRRHFLVILRHLSAAADAAFVLRARSGQSVSSAAGWV